MLLLSEVASLGEARLASGGAAQNHVAAGAHGGDLGVGEDCLKTKSIPR